MRQRHLIIILLSLTALGSWGLSRLGSTRVVYAGKSIAQWLDNGFEDASFALHETGPIAAGEVFRKLRWEHPTYGYWSRYRRVHQVAPGLLRWVLPRPRPVAFDESRAAQALLAMGPLVAPKVIKGLSDSHPAVRLACTEALVGLAMQRRPLRAALPLLARNLQSDNADLVLKTALAISLLKGQQPADGVTSGLPGPAQSPSASH
jgi:hypothetical protein